MKNRNPFTFYITYNQITGNAELCIVEETPGHRRIAKPVKLVFEDMKEGENYKATLDIPNSMSKYFLEAMGKFCKNMKLDVQSDTRLEGENIAMKKHLEDMRKLVFNK